MKLIDWAWPHTSFDWTARMVAAPTGIESGDGAQKTGLSAGRVPRAHADEPKLRLQPIIGANARNAWARGAHPTNYAIFER